MAIRFNCTNCADELEVDDADGGHKVECPKCGRWQQAPLKKQRARCDHCDERIDDEVPCDRCAAVLCSERCLDRHERRKHRRRRRFSGPRCPYCDSTDRPVYRKQIAVAGWVLFAVLLLFCWPLCFLGLLIQEDAPYCADCGAKLA